MSFEGPRWRCTRINRFRPSERMVMNIKTTHRCQIIGYNQTANDNDDEKEETYGIGNCQIV